MAEDETAAFARSKAQLRLRNICWAALRAHPFALTFGDRYLPSGMTRIPGGWILTVFDRQPLSPETVLVRVVMDERTEACTVHPNGDPTIYETVNKIKPPGPTA